MNSIKDLNIFFCREGILENIKGVSRLLKTNFTPVKSIKHTIYGDYFYLILDDNGYLHRNVIKGDYFEKLSFDFLIRDISIIKSRNNHARVMILSRDFNIYLSSIYTNSIAPMAVHRAIPENIQKLKFNLAISENNENLYFIDHDNSTTNVITCIQIQSSDDFCKEELCYVTFLLDNNNIVLYKLQYINSNTNFVAKYTKLLLYFDDIRFEHIYDESYVNEIFINIVTDTNGFSYILKKNNCCDISNYKGIYSNNGEYVVYKINIENPITSVNGSYISTKNEIYKFSIVSGVLSMSNITAEFICDGLTSLTITEIPNDIIVNPKRGRFTKSAKI